MTRLFGILFMLILLAAGVGYCRGWYTVEAADGSLTLSLDKDRVKNDTAKATEAIGNLSRTAAERIRNLARRVGDGYSELQGNLVAVDPVQRSVEIEASGEAVPLVVPAGVPLILNGAEVELDALRDGDVLTVQLERVAGADGADETFEIRRVQVERH